MISTIETKVMIKMDIKRDELLLEQLEREINVKPKKYEIGTDVNVGLIKIVENIGKFAAVKSAAAQVGAPFPFDYKNVNTICVASICATNIIGIPFDYSVLDVSVTGTVYRILRMAARGHVHIYGLSDKQFYDRMNKTREKYNKKQSDELLKLFKQGLITTVAKV